MIDLATHRLALFEARVTLNGSTWLTMLAEYPKGRVTPLISSMGDDMCAPPVERTICQHLGIKPTQLRTIETTTTGAIIYVATIEKENK